MEKEGDPSGGWRFAQCFGDKGEVEEITEGKLSNSHSSNSLFPELVKTDNRGLRWQHLRAHVATRVSFARRKLSLLPPRSLYASTP